MNIEKRAEAVQSMRSLLNLSDDEEIVKTKTLITSLIAKHGKGEWISHMYDDEIAKLSDHDKEIGMAAMMCGQGHFGWGMGVRNWLRSKGFGEKELDVENLDDYYIEIVEDALTSVAESGTAANQS